MILDIGGKAESRRPSTSASREAEAMAAALAEARPASDAEAFGLLRRSFPRSPLSERVVAVGLWRAG